MLLCLRIEYVYGVMEEVRNGAAATMEREV